MIDFEHVPVDNDLVVQDSVPGFGGLLDDLVRRVTLPARQTADPVAARQEPARGCHAAVRAPDVAEGAGNAEVGAVVGGFDDATLSAAVGVADDAELGRDDAREAAGAVAARSMAAAGSLPHVGADAGVACAVASEVVADCDGGGEGEGGEDEEKELEKGAWVHDG